MDWFRFYSEAISDKKLRRIARTTNQAPATVIGIWTILLSIASESPERGRLLLSAGVPATDDDIADLAGCNVTETLLQLEEIGLITRCNDVLSITAWQKRQYTSDSSAERVKQYRERLKTAPITPNVTAEKRYSNADVTPPDTDTDTETEKIERVDDAERAAALTPGPTVARASTTRTVAVKPNAKLSPAVNAYAQLTGKFPPRALHHLIDAAMATRDDPDLLRRCYETWLSRGFRPENNAWLLEWYTSGAIPQSQNGNSRPPPAQAGYAIRYTDKGAFLPDGSQVE